VGRGGRSKYFFYRKKGKLAPRGSTVRKKKENIQKRDRKNETQSLVGAREYRQFATAGEGGILPDPGQVYTKN